MAKRLDIPEETIQKIRILLEEKKAAKFWSYRLSFAGISEVTGVSKNIIVGMSYHRARINPEGIKRENLKPEEVKKVKKILLDKDFGRIDMNYKDIADMLGCSYFTIRNIHNGLIYTKY